VPRPRDPSLAHILQATIEKCQRQIHKAEPARVIAYNAEAQTVDVQPLIQRDQGPGGRSEPEFETGPPYNEVPVCWPGGSAGFLHVPLEPGDNVLIVHCDQNYARWWVSGSISVPEIRNLHGLHPIAIPGLRHEAQPLPVSSGTHVTLAATDELRLGDDGATAPVALAPLVEDQLADLVTRIGLWKAAINALPPATPVTNGTLAGFIEALEEILSGWPGSVGASKVRAV
jgi:hypothetical protein